MGAKFKSALLLVTPHFRDVRAGVLHQLSEADALCFITIWGVVRNESCLKVSARREQCSSSFLQTCLLEPQHVLQ